MLKRNRNRLLVEFMVACTFIMAFSIFACQPVAERYKPNIILIMSDDMGYSDLGCYGGEIETPVLDSLAEEGVRFTQFYNAARCCPSRASLISGLYPHQVGIGHMTNPSKNFKLHDHHVPGYRGELSNQCHTIAEVLKNVGYRTMMVGKWHLGMERQELWPLQRGFDRFYGILDGASNYFRPVHPQGIFLDNEPIEIHDSHYYITDAFTDNAIKFIQQVYEADPTSPFFLYLAYTAPHWPLQAPKAAIDKYRSKYTDGWAPMRQDRYERMVGMGLIDPAWQMSPSDGVKWESLSLEKREEMALRRAIYAAQIDQMDHNIGRLVTTLKTNRLLENTLIIFINDNGACAEGGMFGAGRKAELETRTGYNLSYGRSWANASNTPYREYKHWVHEGGISSPLIAHWPKGISSSIRGKIVNHYSFLPDIMATLVDITGAKYMSEKNGKPIPPMVGKSFFPILKGEDSPIHEQPIFWEHEGNKAVRLGSYKAVMKWKNNKPPKWELYNISKDRTEICDLSEKDPGKLRELVSAWEKWATTHNVRPWEEIRNSLQANKHVR